MKHLRVGSIQLYRLVFILQASNPNQLIIWRVIKCFSIFGACNHHEPERMGLDGCVGTLVEIEKENQCYTMNVSCCLFRGKTHFTKLIRSMLLSFSTLKKRDRPINSFSLCMM